MDEPFDRWFVGYSTRHMEELDKFHGTLRLAMRDAFLEGLSQGRRHIPAESAREALVAAKIALSYALEWTSAFPLKEPSSYADEEAADTVETSASYAIRLIEAALKEQE